MIRESEKLLQEEIESGLETVFDGGLDNLTEILNQMIEVNISDITKIKGPEISFSKLLLKQGSNNKQGPEGQREDQRDSNNQGNKDGKENILKIFYRQNPCHASQ